MPHAQRVTLRRLAILLPTAAVLLSSSLAGADWTIPTGCTGQFIPAGPAPAGICLFEDTKFRYRAFVQFDDNDFSIFETAHHVTANWEWLLQWDDFPPEDEGPN